MGDGARYGRDLGQRLGSPPGFHAVLWTPPVSWSSCSAIFRTPTLGLDTSRMTSPFRRLEVPRARAPPSAVLRDLDVVHRARVHVHDVDEIDARRIRHVPDVGVAARVAGAGQRVVAPVGGLPLRSSRKATNRVVEVAPGAADAGPCRARGPRVWCSTAPCHSPMWGAICRTSSVPSTRIRPVSASAASTQPRRTGTAAPTRTRCRLARRRHRGRCSGRRGEEGVRLPRTGESEMTGTSDRRRSSSTMFRARRARHCSDAGAGPGRGSRSG